MSPADPDEAWLRQVHAEHGGVLLGYALRLTGDRQAAEDVVQEALVRAWRNADRLRAGSQGVRGWLFTVTRNLVYDRHRARQARPREVAPGAAEPSPVPDPAEAVVDSVVVLDALNRLTPEHREVLVTVYYGGRTAAEAGALLGIPVGTVKSRVYYALRALKLAYAETGGGAS